MASKYNSTAVQVALNGSASFRIGRLAPDGRFSIVRPPRIGEVEFAGPFEDCDLPLRCKEIGLCRKKPLGGICSCLPGFSYQNFAKEPVKNNVTLSVYQDLCSLNCSCLGFFHEISFGSCYLLANHLGSFILADHNKDRLGYIKVLVGSSNRNRKQNLPVVALVLLPLTGFLILVVFVIIAILWLRKKRLSKTKTVKLDRSNSSSSAELEMISIPGLPRRFAYEELVAATENFRTQIGSCYCSLKLDR